MVLMKGSESNIKNSLSEFQRYIRGEMTKGEERSFRLKLQDGPFAQAIIEGCFSGFCLPEADKVIDFQDKPFKKSDHRSGKRVFIYSITAVTAFLMIGFGGYIILESNIHSWLQRGSIFTPGPPEARGTSHITGDYPAGSISVTDSVEKECGLDLSAFTVDTAGISMKEQDYSGDDTGTISASGFIDSGKVAARDNLSASGTSSGIQSELQPEPELPDKIIDATATAGDEPAVHQAPQPADGADGFKNYIEANIKKPETHLQGNEAVAVVSFLVRATGLIDSIKVISSQGEEYSREAIRLIREGPAWKPAKESGKSIDEEVSLRIVFR